MSDAYVAMLEKQLQDLQVQHKDALANLEVAQGQAAESKGLVAGQKETISSLCNQISFLEKMVEKKNM